MVPESAKDPLLILTPVQGLAGGGVLSRAMYRVGNSSGLTPRSPTSILSTTLLKDQRPQVSPLRSSPIFLLQTHPHGLHGDCFITVVTH